MRGRVEFRGAGYSIIYDAGYDPKTGKRKQKRESGFRTRKEAEAALADRIAKVERGEFADPGKLTVGEFLSRWFETHRQTLSPSSRRRYEGIIKLHLIPGLGRTLLGKLNALQIQEFLAAESDYGRKDNKKSVGTTLTPAAVQYEYRVLKTALSQAVAWGLIIRNPAEFVKAPKPARREIQILDEKQISALLERVKDTYLYMPVFLAVYTGMRMGEICGLTWNDIDFSHGVIQVRQASVQRNVDTPEFREPKTPRSRRSIDISPVVIRTLREHKRTQAKWRLAAGSAWHDFNLVCSLENGWPINPPTLSSRFGDILKAMHLPGSFHALRHTHVSLLIKAGVPIKVISERLGHSSVAVTMDVYGHLIPGMQKEAAFAFEELLSRNGS